MFQSMVLGGEAIPGITKGLVLYPGLPKEINPDCALSLPFQRE